MANFSPNAMRRRLFTWRKSLVKSTPEEASQKPDDNIHDFSRNRHSHKGKERKNSSAESTLHSIGEWTNIVFTFFSFLSFFPFFLFFSFLSFSFLSFFLSFKDINSKYCDGSSSACRFCLPWNNCIFLSHTFHKDYLTNPKTFTPNRITLVNRLLRLLTRSKT